MKKCAIITTFIEGNIKELLPNPEDYFVICADGGYARAAEAGIKPDLIIGDLDSYKGEIPKDVPIEKLPTEKDDTDTGHSLTYAIEQGYKDIVIVGGIGGRFDHTVSNVQNAAGACDRGVRVTLVSDGNEYTAVKNGSISIKKREGWKLSVFSLTEKCEGVTLRGVYYPLENATLTHTFPLGTSNEFVDGDAEISVKNGMLLVVISRD